DFGLARAVAGSTVLNQTLVGTLGYAPLEQMQGRADARSDLYSLGVTLHHLMTGQYPVDLTVAPLREALPDAHPLLASMVDRATEMMPADRFATAEEMLVAVDAVIELLPEMVAAPPPPLVVPPPSQERILVVDDEDPVRRLIRRILERELYSVLEAENGQQGLELALLHQPDLILSDVQMPGMDGLALCRRLQGNRMTRNIPVLFLTARTDVSDEAMGLQVGAEDYVGKPIVAERLLARVNAILRRRTR
ncbi:MAG TPA: response regulator, partial [Candidatus Xenobia bacterium]